MDLLTAVRRAVAARKEHQETEAEHRKAPTVQTWVRSKLAEKRKHEANDRLSEAICSHLGIDPNAVDDAAIWEATARLCGEAMS